MIERVPVDAIIVRMILASRARDNLEPSTVGKIEQVETEKIIWGSQCQPRGPGKTKAIALVEIVPSYWTLRDRVTISLKSPIGGISLIVKVVVANHVIFAVDAKCVMTPIGK